MASFHLPLVIVQGEPLDKRLTWKLRPTPQDEPAPIDLTDCQAQLQVRATVQSPQLLVALDTADGSITLGGAAGTIRLLLTQAQTAAITWQTGVYDMKIVHADGTHRRLLHGTVTVLRQVTR